jgi:hypothetical protein
MKLHGSNFITLVAIAVTVMLVGDSAARAASLDGSLVNLVVCKSPGKTVSDSSVTSAFTSGSAKKSATFGKAVRTLRVYESKSGPESGCLATYSKTNVEKTVGSSRQTKQCHSILEGIRKNLESSNWSCKQAMDPSVVKSTLAAVSDTSVDSVSGDSDDLENELNNPDSTVR